MILSLVQDDAAERSMRKIETIKKELYERIRAQVTDRIGLQDREINKAEKSFKRFFSQVWKPATPTQLQRQINQSNLIIWGDFHGVRQYQNNLLRWLKNQDLKQTPIVVALECLPSQSQKWVNEYLKSRISEEEFLRKVKWDKVWGFPWTHYKPLFDWASENRQILRVINGPQNKSTSRQREIWGLKLLAEIALEFPKSRIFSLYGEYHLLPKGFPSLIKKLKVFKPVYVFQNSDLLYFQQPPKNQSEEGKILRMNSTNFCIQNMSPWVKWQNFNLFLEEIQEADVDEDLDLTDHVLGSAEILSKALEISQDPNRYAVFTSGDRVLWDHLRKLPEAELRLFECLIEENMSFVYLPGDWAFLGRISANETASLAMQALFFQFNPKLGWKGNSDSDWEFLIWIHAFSYFGSKLINPHRKSPTLLDLQKKSRLSSGRAAERQAARLAVNYTLHQSLGGEKTFIEISLSDQVRFQAVKWISGLLGEKIFNAYNQGSLNLTTLKVFMKKNPGNKKFHAVVQNLYETVDGF